MTSQELRPVIAGNWKMYKTRADARQLASRVVESLAGQLDLPEVILCPPFTALETVITTVKESQVAVAAQNMDWHDQGAFTGEVSPLMLVDLGVTHVIIGHSERRQFFGETNGSVNSKLTSAIRHKLVPILCVGETLDERENNLTDSVVARQTAAALANLTLFNISNLIIAYEPVWAIGTGKVCQAKEASRVAKLIKKTVNNLFNSQDAATSRPVLYGGSVKVDNVDEILAEPDIDGALVGGASLKAEEFLSLIESARKAMCLSTSKA